MVGFNVFSVDDKHTVGKESSVAGMIVDAMELQLTDNINGLVKALNPEE